MMGVLTGFAVILVIIGAGYLAAITGIVQANQRRVLNDVSFYIALPALLFDVLQRSDPSVLISPVILVASIVAVIAAGLYIALSRLFFRRDLASTALGATSSGYVNSNNLGLPIAIYILGDAAYVAPLMLVQLVIFTPIILAVLETTRGNQRGALVALGRASRNPVIIASLLGILFAVFKIDTPEIVLAPIEMLGAASIPMVLLGFGISLRGQRALQPGSGRVAVLTAAAIKLVGMPLIAWLASLALGLSHHETFVIVTIAALPTAQNIYNYAATYRRAETQVRDTVLITTFLSIPVIAIVAWLLGP